MSKYWSPPFLLCSFHQVGVLLHSTLPLWKSDQREYYLILMGVSSALWMIPEFLNRPLEQGPGGNDVITAECVEHLTFMTSWPQNLNWTRWEHIHLKQFGYALSGFTGNMLTQELWGDVYCQFAEAGETANASWVFYSYLRLFFFICS